MATKLALAALLLIGMAHTQFTGYEKQSLCCET